MKTIIVAIINLLAKRILKKYAPEIVGITGSVGKTTTKEIALHILRHRFRVGGSADNYNTEIGLPLAVIGVKSPGRSVIGWLLVLLRGFGLLLFRHPEYPELLVLEMSSCRPGNIAFFTRLVQCTVGVVTAISPAHLEFFKTLKQFSRENQLLVANLTKNGFTVLNRDDSEAYAMRDKTDADVITFGFHPDADIRASDMTLKMNAGTGWPDGVLFKLTHQGSVVPIFLPGTIGDHVIYPTLASVAVSLAFGMNLVEISQVMQTVLLPPGRMHLLDGIKGTLIIDDTYNSSPVPLRAALETLSHVAPQHQGGRYAVLGDMLELGVDTESAHREAGLRVAELGIGFLITVGPAMKIAARAAKDAGFPDDHIASFGNAAEAGRFLQQKLQPGDVILVKGSRAIHMERVVKEVLAEPERAEELLVH